MSKLVVILGEQGTGKSSSIRGLDPSSTMVISVLAKTLPLRGASAAYSKERKNYVEGSDYEMIIKVMDYVSKKRPEICHIVIDDATYIMRDEFFQRSSERGFDKFTDLAYHFRKVIVASTHLRDDITVVMMLHSTVEESETLGERRVKAATIGRLLDRQYNPLENCDIILYASPDFNDVSGKPRYGFWTHMILQKGIIYPAKTPEGMFEEDFIDNDLALVISRMKQYYNEEKKNENPAQDKEKEGKKTLDKKRDDPQSERLLI